MDLRKSKIKVSRRLGIAITPKAAKYMERRPYPPGQHGPKQAKKVSDYGKQLMEKQKLRAQYNISEKQMRIGLAEALQKKGSSIDNLVHCFETRLDAVMLRSGFSRTIFAARQFVSHGHVTLNGKKINVPSARLKVGDVLAVRETSRTMPTFADLKKSPHGNPPPDYLLVNLDDLSVKLKYLPIRDQVPVECNVQSVIEFYSR